MPQSGLTVLRYAPSDWSHPMTATLVFGELMLFCMFAVLLAIADGLP